MEKPLILIHESEYLIRSIVKSITFRITAIISDFLIVFFVTKTGDETIQIVAFTNISSTFLYYIHERIWSHIRLWKERDGHAATHRDHVLRSITKSITYRILVIISDFLIASFITGNTFSALGIIVFTDLASTILYFIHERIWNQIRWGKKHLPASVLK